LVGVLVAAAAPNLLRACGGQAPKRGASLRLFVPAYFYPAGEGARHWDRLIRAAERVNVVAIANPAGGPGQKADPNYAKVIGRARKAGVTLLGYVSTRFAKRPPAEVKADVDRWVRLYPDVRGFFFDEQASAADRVDYYAALYRYAARKIKGCLVATNPGTICAKEYLSRPAADLVCLFENAKGFDDFKPPAWVKEYPPRRFAAAVHHTADAQRMRLYLRAAVRRGIGNVYVTDAGGANPWDRLPSYWDEEVKAAEQLGGGRQKKGFVGLIPDASAHWFRE
jgi:hypothetical protein